MIVIRQAESRCSEWRDESPAYKPETRPLSGFLPRASNMRCGTYSRVWAKIPKIKIFLFPTALWQVDQMSDDHQNDTCPQCGAAVEIFPGGLDYDLHFCSDRCGWGGPVRTMTEGQAEALYHLLKSA
jgi:hypothetical protein